MEPLTDTQIADALTGLPDWEVVDNRLHAAYKVGRPSVQPFYTAVAAAEDELNHHANVSIVYGTVTFDITTHDVDNQITGLDVELAKVVSDIAQAYTDN